MTTPDQGRDEVSRPKYPNVVVQLIGTDGNAFAILGAVTKALKQAGISKEERDTFVATIPSRFDLDDVMHVTIIDEIRDKYSAFLSDESDPYSRCMYRPASLLPYPKAVIRKALEALLDFIEGRRQSRFLDASIRSPEAADMVRTSLQLLDDFLDVPAEKLPTDPRENARIGLQLQRSQS